MEEFLGILQDFLPVSGKLEIDLRDNSFKDHHMKPIANLIKKSIDLKDLNIWMPANFLTDKGASELFGALDGLKKLTSLTINLEWNFRLTNKSLQVLCSKLRGLTQLKQLRVYMSK